MGLLEEVRGYQAAVQYLMKCMNSLEPRAPYDDYLDDLDDATEEQLRAHLEGLKDAFAEAVQHVNGQKLYQAEFSRWRRRPADQNLTATA